MKSHLLVQTSDLAEQESDERSVRWTTDDVVLYHAGIGAGNSPDQRTEEQYVRREGPVVLPSFAVALGMPEASRLEWLLGDDIRAFRQVAQEVEIPAPLPAEGAALVTFRPAIDEGCVVIESTIRDEAQARLLAISRAKLTTEDSSPPAARFSDPPGYAQFTVRIDSRMALWYRSSGDAAPALTAPGAVAVVNPRLVYGALCKAVIDELLGGAPQQVTHFAVDFCEAVNTGETLAASAWETDGGIALEVRTVERPHVVVCQATVGLEGGEWTEAWAWRAMSFYEDKGQ